MLAAQTSAGQLDDGLQMNAGEVRAPRHGLKLSRYGSDGGRHRCAKRSDQSRSPLRKFVVGSLK